jgi:hypothetical protein
MCCIKSVSVQFHIPFLICSKEEAFFIIIINNMCQFLLLRCLYSHLSPHDGYIIKLHECTRAVAIERLQVVSFP